MLQNAKELYRCILQATDASVGKVYDIIFDDRTWAIQYLVVVRGGWLSSRLLCISVAFLRYPDWKAYTLPVALTKAQVEDSPSISSICCQLRNKLPSDWPIGWGGGRLLVAGFFGTETKTENMPTEEHEVNPHLRSLREAIGCHAQANDGKIGHVKGFIVDSKTWSIRYVVIDTRKWLPVSSKVLVAAQWVGEVCWHKREFRVDLSQQMIENYPKFNPAIPLDREYEERFYDYYGRPKYWL